MYVYKHGRCYQEKACYSHERKPSIFVDLALGQEAMDKVDVDEANAGEEVLPVHLVDLSWKQDGKELV